MPFDYYFSDWYLDLMLIILYVVLLCTAVRRHCPLPDNIDDNNDDNDINRELKCLFC